MAHVNSNKMTSSGLCAVGYEDGAGGDIPGVTVTFAHPDRQWKTVVFPGTTLADYNPPVAAPSLRGFLERFYKNRLYIEIGLKL